MMKKLTCLLAALALAASLTACGGANTSAPAAESTSAPAQATGAADAGQKPTQDRAGNPITVPAEIGSIASMTPSNTQIVLDLGLGDKLVAVDVDSAWMFPAVADLPALDTYNPDLEQLMVLAPDILFSAELNTGGGDSPFLPLIEAGLCVADVPTANSLDEIYADVLFVAACLGEDAKGEQLVAGAQATIAAVAAVGATIEQRRSVLFEISALPAIYAPGEGVYLDEIFGLIGADNAIAGTAGWVPVSEEAAVAANPDVILTNVEYIDDAVAEIMARDGWQSMNAVANGEVYFITNATTSLPNHHVAEAVVEMAKAIYPEAYADF